MEELAHGGAGDGFAVLAIGLETLAEGADRGIVLPGHYGRQGEYLAQPGRVGMYSMPTVFYTDANCWEK